MSFSLNKALLLALCVATPALASGQSPHVLVQTDPLRTADAADDEDNTAPVIQTSALANPSIDGFGTLEESNGGLPAAIWKNSKAQAAESLLTQFSSGIANDTLRDLTMRLLMTQATAPEGAGNEWFMARVDALIAIGLDDKAGQLIASVPTSMVTDNLRAKHAQLLLLRGDVDTACKVDMGDPATTAAATTSLFWTKLLILCKAHAGKKDEAMVGLDMLGDQSHDDLFFQEAIRKLNDKAVVIKSIPKQWAVLDVAVLRLANEPGILKDHLEAFPPATLKYIAADTSLDAKIRDKATIRAQQLGVMPVKDANKTPEPPFSRTLASDVTTLVTALGSGKPAGSGDNEVIARLAVDEGAAIQDTRRVQRLLTFMEPFGYTIPPSIWQKLAVHKSRYDGETPAASLVSRLNDAAQAGRKGEVILLSALIMDGTDADRTIDLALLPVIKSLQAAGFDKEARLIAYSAVKSYGH